MNWHDVAPADVAIAQISWERDAAVCRMRQCGLKLHEIGKRIGRGPQRVRQLLDRHERQVKAGRRSTIERWIDPAKAAAEVWLVQGSQFFLAAQDVLMTAQLVSIGSNQPSLYKLPRDKWTVIARRQGNGWVWVVADSYPKMHCDKLRAEDKIITMHRRAAGGTEMVARGLK